MQAGETIFVKNDSLMQEAEKLTETLEYENKARNVPKLSGSGYMPDKLNEMVLNMKVLHNKVLELVLTSAEMLEKMGFEFDELDQVTARIYKNIK